MMLYDQINKYYLLLQNIHLLSKEALPAKIVVRDSSLWFVEA